MGGGDGLYSIEVGFREKVLEELIEIGGDGRGRDLDKEVGGYYN